jgi:GGDEF domain-containing protein
MEDKLDINNVSYEAAQKANEDLGDIRDASGKRLLGTATGTNVLDKYEKAEYAYIDTVTGLSSFRALNEWLDKDEERQKNQPELSEEHRKTEGSYPTFGVIVCMDADGLGNANELGHEEGDRLLNCIADAGREVAHRPNDQIFRRGDKSDEIIIILPGVTDQDFESLNKIIENQILEKRGSKNYSASMIFGTYGKGKSARLSLSEIDKLLSAAKAKREKGVHLDPIFVGKGAQDNG